MSKRYTYDFIHQRDDADAAVDPSTHYPPTTAMHPAAVSRQTPLTATVVPDEWGYVHADDEDTAGAPVEYVSPSGATRQFVRSDVGVDLGHHETRARRSRKGRSTFDVMRHHARPTVVGDDRELTDDMLAVIGGARRYSTADLLAMADHLLGESKDLGAIETPHGLLVGTDGASRSWSTGFASRDKEVGADRSDPTDFRDVTTMRHSDLFAWFPEARYVRIPSARVTRVETLDDLARLSDFEDGNTLGDAVDHHIDRRGKVHLAQRSREGITAKVRADERKRYTALPKASPRAPVQLGRKRGKLTHVVTFLDDVFYALAGKVMLRPEPTQGRARTDAGKARHAEAKSRRDTTVRLAAHESAVVSAETLAATIGAGEPYVHEVDGETKWTLTAKRDGQGRYSLTLYRGAEQSVESKVAAWRARSMDAIAARVTVAAR